MKKFDGILMCTDLDGTLFRRDKTVSKENLEAIEYFKAEGGLFTFNTGRMPFSVPDLCELIRPNAPVVGNNGGGIYDYKKGQYLWQEWMPASALDLLEYIDGQMETIGFQINTSERIYFCRENFTMQEFRRITGAPNLQKPYREVSEPISKIVFGVIDVADIPRIQEMVERHPIGAEVSFVNSERHLCELLPRNTNKGRGLSKLADLLGIDMQKTVAVGDYNNDIEMLQVAGVGIAVENALPAVKAVADRVTVSNEDHAIARIVDDLESQRILFN